MMKTSALTMILLAATSAFAQGEPEAAKLGEPEAVAPVGESPVVERPVVESPVVETPAKEPVGPVAAPSVVAAPVHSTVAEAPARAVPARRPARFQLFLGNATQVVSYRGYDMFDANDLLTRLRVGVGRPFELSSLPFSLDVEVAYTTGTTSETLYALRTSTLWMRGVEGTASLRYPLFHFLEPYAGAVASADWASVSVTTGGLQQTAFTPALGGIAGVQIPVRLSSVSATSLLFDVGLGYTARVPGKFDALTPEAPEKPADDDVRRGAVPFGTLPLSGMTYRLTVGFRI